MVRSQSVQRSLYAMLENCNLTIFSVTSNTSKPNGNATIALPLVQAILGGTLMSIIVLGAIYGNMLVIASVASNRKLRTITNFYLVSLAMADLLVATLVMPIAIVVQITGRWWFGVIACDIYVLFDSMLCTASILNLCCISLDRYFAITKPLKYSTKRSKRLALIMICITWIVAALICCPPIFGWREEGRWENTHECVLTRDPGYIIYSSLGAFYLPLLVMSAVYLRIMIVISRRNKFFICYQRKFHKYTGRFVCATGSESRNTHEVSGNVSPLSGVRADCEKPGFSCDATVMAEYHGGAPKLVHLSPPISESMPTQTSQDVEAETRTHRPLNAQCEVEPQGVDQLQDIVAKSHDGENHTEQSLSTGSNIEETSIQQKEGWTIRLWISFPGRACKANKDRAAENASTKENKAAKTLAVVVGGFVVCWMPFFIIYPIEPFCESCRIDHTAFLFCTWLGYFNSMINPFIYAFYNRDFRHTFWKLTFGRLDDRTNTRRSWWSL